jgi:uncharacterized protein (DUF3084 family)
MFAALDSLGAILGLIITGLVAVLAVLAKLFTNERSKRKDAEEQVDQVRGVVEKERESRTVAKDVEKKAKEREEQKVEDARKGRRDYFEEQ